MDIKDFIAPFAVWKRAFEKPFTVQETDRRAPGRPALPRLPHERRGQVRRLRNLRGHLHEQGHRPGARGRPRGRDGDSGLRPRVDYGRCCWCALCVDICPSGSLNMSNEYVWIDSDPEVFRYTPGRRAQALGRRRTGLPPRRRLPPAGRGARATCRSWTTREARQVLPGAGQGLLPRAGREGSRPLRLLRRLHSLLPGPHGHTRLHQGRPRRRHGRGPPAPVRDQSLPRGLRPHLHPPLRGRLLHRHRRRSRGHTLAEALHRRPGRAVGLRRSPCPGPRRPRARRWPWSARVPAASSAAYYLALLGHEVTVFEKDGGRGRHAALRHPRVPPALPRPGQGHRLYREPGRQDPVRRRSRQGTDPGRICDPSSTPSTCPPDSRPPTGWTCPGTSIPACWTAWPCWPPRPAAMNSAWAGGSPSSAAATSRWTPRAPPCGTDAEVDIVYRRREQDMPADAEEISEAKAEGARLIEKAIPLEVKDAGARRQAAVSSGTRPRWSRRSRANARPRAHSRSRPRGALRLHHRRHRPGPRPVLRDGDGRRRDSADQTRHGPNGPHEFPGRRLRGRRPCQRTQGRHLRHRGRPPGRACHRPPPGREGSLTWTGNARRGPRVRHRQGEGGRGLL